MRKLALQQQLDSVQAAEAAAAEASAVDEAMDGEEAEGATGEHSSRYSLAV